jgi:hypothetical protein
MANSAGEGRQGPTHAALMGGLWTDSFIECLAERGREENLKSRMRQKAHRPRRRSKAVLEFEFKFSSRKIAAKPSMSDCGATATLRLETTSPATRPSGAIFLRRPPPRRHPARAAW